MRQPQKEIQCFKQVLGDSLHHQSRWFIDPSFEKQQGIEQLLILGKRGSMLLFFYIVMELIFPLLLAMGIISSILLMDQVFQFIPFLQATNVEIVSILQMVLFSLPPSLMLATPVSMLIGVYVGISRISSDSELIVMRASGISISFLFKPVIFVAMAVAVFIMMLSFYLAPIGITKLERLKFNILKKQTKINLSVGKINNFFGQKLIYIFEKNEDQLKGLFIADWNEPKDHPIIEANNGNIRFDEKNKRVIFHLLDGKIHYSPVDGNYRVIEFDQLDYNLAPPNIERKDLPKRYRDENSEQKEKLDMELTVEELIERIRRSPSDSTDYLEYTDELHGRIVTILSSICFAIFALPMGIYDPRNPKAGNIIYMITVLTLYFLIFANFRSMLVQGKVPPLSLYSPLVLVIGIAAFKYAKVNYNLNSFGEYIRLKLSR